MRPRTLRLLATRIVGQYRLLDSLDQLGGAEDLVGEKR